MVLDISKKGILNAVSVLQGGCFLGVSFECLDNEQTCAEEKRTKANTANLGHGKFNIFL